MSARGLTIFKLIISLISCCIFIWASWQPSPFTYIHKALIPILLLLPVFFVSPHNTKHQAAVFGAVGSALGFMALNESPQTSFLSPFAAILLASAAFFYCILNACSGKAHADIEQRLQHFTESRVFFYLCLAVAVIGLAAQLIFSFSPNIWVDEAFSVSLTAHPWAEMLSIAATDVHPPLYYLILKALTACIHFILPNLSPICIGKLVSALPYAIMLILAATKVRRTWGNYVGGLWGVALFAAPSIISQGVEIRMYSWAILFVVLAYLFAYDVITKARKRDWCCFVLAGLASAYTHYYACIAVSPVYLLLLFVSLKNGRSSLLRWLVAATATVVCYLPWLFIFLNQAQTVSNDYWIAFPDIQKYRLYTTKLFRNTVTTGFVFLIIFLQFLAIYREKEQRLRNSYIATGILCLVACFGVGMAVSYIIRPVFVFRYLYPGLACFWLALIIGANVTAGNMLKLSFAGIMVSCCFSQYTIFGLSEGKQAKELVRLTEQIEQYPNAVIITANNSEQSVFSTLTDRTCLTFDKKATSELSQKVYPACRQPNIADIQSFINQKTHPTYILLLSAGKNSSKQPYIPRQYHKGRFYEAELYDMYVIPATEKGADH